MAATATTVKKPSENSPIKRARRRRCERKQTPQNRVRATKGKSWEKTAEDACLPTEQEKVARFEQLGIGPELLPKRIYAGRANGRIRYFHVKMPIAVEQDRALFVYIDPGMTTPKELQSWGRAHRELWARLRRAGRSIEVDAVAWDQKHLDRTQRVLQVWTTRDPAAAKTEAAGLRQAIADADWDTVERHGGLDAVVAQAFQENRYRTRFSRVLTT